MSSYCDLYQLCRESLNNSENGDLVVYIVLPTREDPLITK